MDDQITYDPDLNNFSSNPGDYSSEDWARIKAEAKRAEEPAELKFFAAEDLIPELRRGWPKLLDGAKFCPIRAGERVKSGRRTFWKDVRRTVPRTGVRYTKDGRRETFLLPSPMSGRQLRKYRRFLKKHGA